MLESSKHSVGDNVKAKLDEAQNVLGQLMDQVRELSLDLRPPMLDDMGLLPALQWYFQRYTAQTNVKVFFSADGLGGRLHPEVETAAFRIVQEALTNIARHSGATKATVQFRTNREFVSVHVEDKGVGFDPKIGTAKGTGGLSGMRERAVILGGEFTVDSVPGTGTHLTAALPNIRPVGRTTGTTNHAEEA